MEHQFYKDKYIIALYDRSDYLRFVFDSPKEIAEFENSDVRNVYSRISKIRHSKHHYMKINGIKLKMYLIEIEDQE